MAYIPRGRPELHLPKLRQTPQERSMNNGSMNKKDYIAYIKYVHKIFVQINADAS